MEHFVTLLAVSEWCHRADIKLSPAASPEAENTCVLLILYRQVREVMYFAATNSIISELPLYPLAHYTDT